MSVAGLPSEVAAILLAAGMSKRMGAPKQLLRLGGATLLEHALNFGCLVELRLRRSRFLTLGARRADGSE